MLIFRPEKKVLILKRDLGHIDKILSTIIVIFPNCHFRINMIAPHKIITVNHMGHVGFDSVNEMYQLS